MPHLPYRRILSRRAAVMALFLAVVAAAPVRAQSAADEAAKINFLLHSIESLQGAQFIRNGATYSSAEAAAHLRLKWHAAGSDVVTVQDFIRECASKSSVSGVAYSIRFADGRVVPSADFLQQQLLTYLPRAAPATGR
jgi:Family of unknown function (DUF5329)